MKISVHRNLDEIPAEAWNILVADNNPLVRHEFLAAMEHHGCVGESFGWLPRHIAIHEGDKLVAAMPLYEKHNSYGEFVFDHAWAEAWQRAGIRYFPKLVSAVPYTPAAGQRLLCQPGKEATYWPLLQQTATELAAEIGASGIHCLFPDADEQDFLQQQWLARHDCQFHWHNHDYASFDDFLEQLKSKKRKNIRQERRKVTETGVTFRVLNGETASESDWRSFANFYDRTFEEKWGTATFNFNFFTEVAKKLPKNIVLVLADLEGECIAGALMYCSDTTLYGRHWGCTEQIENLHFETCYYQGIDYCIEHGLKLFEPGAQGEHKIARGFLPTLTRSAHWLASNPFQNSIENYITHEQQAIEEYIIASHLKSPYKAPE